MQKVIDQVWQSEMESIYEAYSIYHQSGGTEQAVFEGVSGLPSPRSTRLLEHFHSQVQVPERGRLLDVGCGNGALLRTFGRFAPLWSLVGMEFNDKYRSAVESIDSVEALYTCAADEVPGTFNLITMIHVLEHIPAPKDFLARLWDKLEYGGLLMVEVPDKLENPFDLLVADHCTHFTVSTLTELIQGAGYEVVSVANDWVPKELTLLAHKTEHRHEDRTPILTTCPFHSTVRSLKWLESVVTAARELCTIGAFGLFGTSIAATWLFSELGGSVSFFVDEDPSRIGRTHMGRPIYQPHEVPTDSHVFITLPSRLAEAIWHRVSKPGVTFHLPPHFKPELRA